MRLIAERVLLAGTCIAVGLSVTAAETGGSLEEIIVTAQKREQSLNDVGMSINVVSGDNLAARGVSSTADLSKVIPGLSVTAPNAGITGAPIYTMRGIGFNEKSLSALSAVSFYLDEVPLNYAWMTAGPVLDLQRVEVLKGPQGTLYGQNSTGGALNFIANKPTRELSAGIQGSYGRFNNVDVDGFVSGPLGEKVSARAALRYIQADGWQQSFTRPGDELGEVEQLAARFLLDWDVTEQFRVRLNLNGWRDRSETMGSQLIGYNPYVAFSNPPYIFADALFAIPVDPDDARKTDWTPSLDLHNDNRFGQGSIRAEYDLTDDISLISISSYSYLDTTSPHDPDASHINFTVYDTSGTIDSFNQELRLTGRSMNRLNWIGGVNYSDDTIDGDDLVGSQFGGPGAFLGLTGTNPISHTERTNKAVFASADFDVTPTVNLQAGVRYTEVDLRFRGCARDLGDGTFAALINFLGGGSAAPGECVTYLTQSAASIQQGLVRKEQTENNVSWRTGVNWTPVDGLLLYGNVSRGYKSGDFPTLTGLSEEQYNPVKQEEVTSYEVGLKSTLLDGRMQLNAAVFHYDYKDKQLYAYLNTFVGLGEGTVNIPESTVDGAELEIVVQPADGLILRGAVGYTKTELGDDTPLQVGSFTSAVWPPAPGFIPAGLVDVDGDSFNLAPKWQSTLDGEYTWSVGERLSAFAGASATYSDSTLPTIGASEVARLPSYTSVDLRAGLAAEDESWRLTIWGRNVSNEDYAAAVSRTFDTTSRYAAQPATYGVTLAYRY